MSIKELMMSKRRALENTVNLGSTCLRHDDFLNGSYIYGSIVTGYYDNGEFQGVISNEEMFSIKCCYAYCCVMSNMETLREKGQGILNDITNDRGHPLVIYLKAHNYLQNKKIDQAVANIIVLNILLNNTNNPIEENFILNREILPMLKPQRFREELRKLEMACGVEISKPILRRSINVMLQEMMKIPDFPKLFNPEDIPEDIVDGIINLGFEIQNMQDSPVKFENQAAKTEPTVQTGAVKRKKKKKLKEKPQKEILPEPSKPIVPVVDEKSTQTTSAVKNEGIQTENNTEIAMITEMRDDIKKFVDGQCAFMSAVASKSLSEKDQEIEFLKQQLKYEQDRNNKLVLAEGKILNSLREQQANCESRLVKCQKNLNHLQTMFLGKTLEEYQWHKNIYSKFDDYCKHKVDFFEDIQNFVKDLNLCLNSEICKQQVKHWKKIKAELGENKKKFEAHLKRNEEHLAQGNYSQLSVKWPELPNIPMNEQDILHHNFKNIIQHYLNKSTASATPTVKSQPSSKYITPDVHGGFAGATRIIEPSRPVTPTALVKLTGRYDSHASKTTMKTTSQSHETASNIYNLEKSLLNYLKTNLKDVDEMDLINAVLKTRDKTGNFRSINKDVLLNDVKKMLSEEDKKCCICLESITRSNRLILNCQHEFHKLCIRSWLNHRKECPVCRRYVVTEDFPPLR